MQHPLSHILNQRTRQRHDTSHHQPGVAVVFALAAAGVAGTTKNMVCTDEVVLKWPGFGIFVEVAEEDVDAVGLAEDVLFGADVGDPFGVFPGGGEVGYVGSRPFIVRRMLNCGVGYLPELFGRSRFNS